MSYKVLIHADVNKRHQKLKDKELKSRLSQLFKRLKEPFKLDTKKIKGRDDIYIGQDSEIIEFFGNLLEILFI